MWFGEYRWREWFAALLGAVRDFGTDLIVLQEVTPCHLQSLLTDTRVRRESIEMIRIRPIYEDRLEVFLSDHFGFAGRQLILCCD